MPLVSSSDGNIILSPLSACIELGCKTPLQKIKRLLRPTTLYAYGSQPLFSASAQMVTHVLPPITISHHR
eukprot:gene10946-7599_t